MKLAKLYSRRSDKALQQWEMEIQGNKYRVASGKVGGKLHTNEWTEVQGKNIGRANQTSPDQQAAAEAQSHWQKKWDSGYRETEAELTSTGVFDPMLAKQFEDYADKLAYPVFCQPKLDGIRCIGKVGGLFTRNGKEHMALPHIAAALKKFFAKFPDCIVDGEAYADKYSANFSRICSLVKQPKPTAADLTESEKHIVYHIYDCKMSSPTATFGARIKFLEEELAGVPFIHLVETQLCKDRAELDGWYEKYLADGQEGQIVRVDGLYENKRSSLLLKRKEFQDSEYEILGLGEGTGNRAGTCGWMEFKNAAGLPFKSNVKGNREFVTDLWKNRGQYIGRQATIRYFGLTPGDKIPRFPYVVAIRDGE
jgi:DNA ligase-1